MYGQRTLIIDLDQQANLTKSLGIAPVLNGEIKTLRDAYINNVPIQNIPIEINKFLHLIPSNLNMAKLDTEFTLNTENLSMFFNNFLAPIEHNYDVIFFDCPPSLGRIVSAAQAYSNNILCPVNSNDFSIDGLQLTIDSIRTISKKFFLNPKLTIVMNNFDYRQKLSFEIMGDLNDKYKNNDFVSISSSIISTSKQIDNCFSCGSTFASFKK
jgi:chromosome partitioning protein